MQDSGKSKIAILTCRSDSPVILTCVTNTETFFRKNALLKANVSESSSE